MVKVLVNESSLQDIADAIREKTEGTEKFLPSAMGAAVRTLPSGAKVASGTLSKSKYYSTSDNRYHYGGALTGLDFVPKVIIWSSSNQVLVSNRADYTYTCITNPDTGAPQYIHYGSSSSEYEKAVKAMGDAYAENGTYFLTVENSSSSYTPSGTVYWYAIG